MAPKPASGTKETKPQKGKGRGDELQQNRIHFGLPQSVVQALQSIATRATQDLWSPTIAAAADATAEQGLQRRTNTTNRLSQRLAGNLRAKEELSVALQQWFVLIGQHMLGLLSQVRGLGQKFDEDIVVAAQEMREILAGQPSDATASLVDRALSAAGSSVQEQEVLRLAAGLRAFSTVIPPQLVGSLPSGPSRMGAGSTGFDEYVNEVSGERDSELSFGRRTTGSVPETASLQDLAPTRHPGAPSLSVSQARPMRFGMSVFTMLVRLSARLCFMLTTACMDLCCTVSSVWPLAFRFPSGTVGGPQCPVVLHVDDRVHGPLLHRELCVALGLQVSEWHCRRVVEALPSFPPEQYVLSESSMAWQRILVPVDLRLLGGRVSLVAALRSQPWAYAAQEAAEQQHVSLVIEQLCRVGQSWFAPSACVLLLPQGDTLQVWPCERLVRPAFPCRSGSLSPRLSLGDVFSTSLSLSGPAEVAFHQGSGANSVILYPQGLRYAFAPTFADHLAIRSAVMGDFMSGLEGSVEPFSHFARVLPPA
eukprot:s1821_g5.t1